MIFDTNIFIYADRGVTAAKDLLLATPERAVSAVTYMEYVPFYSETLCTGNDKHFKPVNGLVIEQFRP